MSATDHQHPPGKLTSFLRSISTRKVGADATRASMDPPQTVQETPEEASEAPAVVANEPPASPAPEGTTTTTTVAAAAASTSTPAHEEKKDGPGYLERLKSLAMSKKAAAKKPDTGGDGDGISGDGNGNNDNNKKAQSQPEAEAIIDIRPDAKVPAQSSSELRLDSELAELAAVAEVYTSGAKPAVPPAEPSTLAKLIQTLVDALPPLSADDPVPKPKPVMKNSDGKPIPPSVVTSVKDPKVIAQLNSPTIMNGSPAAGKRSVWSVLEALGPPKHEETSDPGSSGNNDHIPANGSEGDNTSIMLYAPLHPTDDSVVEVAMSELRPSKKPASTKPAEVSAKRFSFPWGSKPKAPPAKLIQVWVPSKTKLSIETKWWGYRIYLPPPVLASLGEKEAEAAKLAAVITAALTWMIEHLPIQLVPLPLQPAVLVLKRIVPYLSYIGAFIAWSWATIIGFNKGYGVILSATWVLPIALIPGAWPPPPTATPPGSSTPPASTTPADPSTPPPTLPTKPTTPPPASSKPPAWKNLFRVKSK